MHVKRKTRTRIVFVVEPPLPLVYVGGHSILTPQFLLHADSSVMSRRFVEKFMRLTMSRKSDLQAVDGPRPAGVFQGLMWSL